MINPLTIWQLAVTGLELFQAVNKVKNPILGGVVKIIDAVVEKKADGVSNEALMTMVEHSAKSAWNNLDAEKVGKIAAVVFDDEEQLNSWNTNKAEWQADYYDLEADEDEGIMAGGEDENWVSKFFTDEDEEISKVIGLTKQQVMEMSYGAIFELSKMIDDSIDWVHKDAKAAYELKYSQFDNAEYEG